MHIPGLNDFFGTLTALLHNDMFGELVVLLLIAAVIGTVAVRLRQPLVIGFIAVGILVGPSCFHLVRAADQIHVLAEMGLSLLLFVVGLKLDLRLIRTLGPVALIAGLGQVVLTCVVGFVLALALGMPPLTGVYIAIALTFSSTIIIVKILSDKHETDSLHGRITLGILIVQDLVVVLAMLALTAFGHGGQQPALLQIGIILLKGIGLFATVWVLTFLVLPRALDFLARSTELLVLFGIALALVLAYFGSQLGFGKEIGAFLAGVSLASTAYRDILGAKLVSLRDFLLLFFFVELGSGLDITSLGSHVLAAAVLTIFVLIGKPVLTMLVMALMGYRKRTGFLTGISLAQISEFSLILVAMGVESKQIQGDAAGVVTLVGLLTIGLSSYFIQDAQRLYDKLAPYLKGFDHIARGQQQAPTVVETGEEPVDIILFGLGEYGTGIAEQLQQRGRAVIGVDYDPQAVASWLARGWTAVFGDAEDPDFAASLPLEKAHWVVSAISHPQVNSAIMRAVRHSGYTGNVAFTARDRNEGNWLVDEYAGLLFVPFEDAAAQAVDLLVLREDEIARETMDKIIAGISGHYVVCGYGRMGQQIVKDLKRSQMPIVVVEDNLEQIPRLKEENIPHIAGNASHDETLLRAGIMHAKGLIAVAASDEENVFIVLTARGLNPRLFIVARSIREENEDKLRRAGADRVMSPYILGGRRMAAVVTKPELMEFLDLLVHSDQPDAEIGHIAVPENSGRIGKTLHELGLWEACGVTVLAVQHEGEDLHANPCPTYVLRAGDELILMGSTLQLSEAITFLKAEESAASTLTQR